MYVISVSNQSHYANKCYCFWHYTAHEIDNDNDSVTSAITNAIDMKTHQ